MKFTYQAKNPQTGQVFQGQVEANSENDASQALAEQGLVVILLEKQESTLGKISFKALFGFKKKVNRKDIVVFARQLSVMISASLPLVQALRIVSEQIDKPAFQKIVIDVADEVESGVKLSAAMGKYEGVFSHFFISIIASGETSGKLDEVLQYLADQEERDYDLQSKIKGAMIYPSFIVSGLVLVGIAMMIFVIPQLTQMLEASGASLPLSTRVLITTSKLMKSYWWAIFVIFGGLYVGFKFAVKNPEGKKIIDNIKLKLPIFGKLFQKIYVVRFSRSLSTLLTGGVSLTAAIKIVAEVVDNAKYQQVFMDTLREVQDGNSLAVVFSKSPLVPRLVSQMIAVGEKTGRLDSILTTISNFYTKEIENTVANLTSLIEPFIMIVIGVAVGGMVASIILPMYNLANQF